MSRRTTAGSPAATPEEAETATVSSDRTAPRRVTLLALCIGPAVLEAAVVVAVGPGGALALASQANAVPPFGVFHDLRWLAVYPPSWGLLAAGGLALVVVRGSLTGVTVAAAWPAGRPRPPLARLVARGMASTLLAGVLLAPSAAVLYGLAVVSVSWLFLAAVPFAVLVAVLVNPVAVDRGWWRRPVPVRAVGWVVVDFAATSLAAVALVSDPRVAAIPVAAVAGALDAWAWRGLVGAVVDQPRRRLAVPMVPVGVAILVVVVLAATMGAFDQAARISARPSPPAPARAAAGGGDSGILLVSGYGSHWRGGTEHPVPGPYLEEPFSYDGLSAGRPLPYTAAQTVAPLGALVPRLRRQIDVLAARTGRPVDIVAESEGSVVVEDLLRHGGRPPPVRAVVLVSPLLDPGRLSYPVQGSSGAGFAARDALLAIADVFQGSAPIDLSPVSAFIRSLDTTRGSSLLLCPVSDVRQYALLPLADAVADPLPAPGPGIPGTVELGFHGGQLGNPVVDRTVAAVLRTGRLAAAPVLSAAERVVRAAAAAWWVPTPDPPTCP